MGLQGVNETTNGADDGAQSRDKGHGCVSDVVVTVTVPNGPSVESTWCLDCLESTEATDAIYQLLPGSSISVRSVAV